MPSCYIACLLMHQDCALQGIVLAIPVFSCLFPSNKSTLQGYFKGVLGNLLNRYGSLRVLHRISLGSLGNPIYFARGVFGNVPMDLSIFIALSFLQ